MDFYLIRHLTKFLYADQVSESLMEARMHPRSDNNQRCLSFSLSVSPRCRVFSYRDHLGNNVHHFDSLRRPPCTLKRSISLRQPDSLFNRPVVLFNHVVEILALA